MNSIIFSYPVIIKESYLDVFGHMNNAMYLTLYEEARWDIINKNGYGIEKIQATGLGPVLLEAKIRFLKEIILNDEIMIESRLDSYNGKIGVIKQKMLRGSDECSNAEFTTALFNLKERKLVIPTDEWLKAVGLGN